MKCECGCGQEVKPGNRFIIGHHRRGISLSTDHKNKISKSETGKVCKPHTDRTKNKISDTLKGEYIGEKHPNWQGGISFGPYCPKFNNKIKEAVREQYNRKCVICGKSEEDNGMKLDVHHIDYNKEQGCEEHEWNLIPLCRSCHMKTNHNRIYWEKRIISRLGMM